MPSFNLKFDDREIQKALKQLQPQRIRAVTQRSLNTALDRSYTAFVREVSKETRLKQQYVRRKSKKVRASTAKLTAQIQVTGRQALNLIEWAGGDISRLTRTGGAALTSGRGRNRRRRGVIANAWGNRKEYKGTFIVIGRGSGKPVVVGIKPGRQPGQSGWTRTIYGPIAWKQIGKEYAQRAMTTTAQRAFIKKLRSQLKIR